MARARKGGFSGATFAAARWCGGGSPREPVSPLALCRATFARVAPGPAGASPGRGSERARDVGEQGAEAMTAPATRAKRPFDSAAGALIGAATPRECEATER